MEAHNFVNNNPFLTVLVPKFRCLTGLYNGTKIVKIESLCTKLGANEVYHVQKNTVHKKHSQFKKNAVLKNRESENLGIDCVFYKFRVVCKVARFSLCTKKRRMLICKCAVFTYVRKPVHKAENGLTKWWSTLQGHNC